MVQWLAAAAATIVGLLSGAVGLVACVDYLDADAGAGIETTETGGRDDGSGVVDSGGDADAGAVGCDYACIVLEDHPLIYLRFEDPANATVASDSSGKGYSGEYPQAGVTKVDGIRPGTQAVRFAGAGSQQITMPPSADFQGSSNFSVEMWVKPDAVSGLVFLIDHEEHDTRGGWEVEISDGNVGMELWQNGSVAAVAVGAGAPLKTGDWHHVVWTYNGSSTMVLIWLDAKLVFSNLTARASLRSVGTWSLGKQNCTPCAGASYAGAMDEVAIYDHLLVQSAVEAHYRAR